MNFFIYDKKKGVFIRNFCMKCEMDLNENLVFSFCGHYFHVECFLKGKCPICELKETTQGKNLFILYVFKKKKI